MRLFIIAYTASCMAWTMEEQVPCAPAGNLRIMTASRASCAQIWARPGRQKPCET